MNKSTRLVKVRFLGQSQPGTFLVGDLSLKYGQQVVAMSERGLAIGFVNSDSFDLKDSVSKTQFHTINKIATEEDIKKYKNLYQEQRRAGSIFRELVDQHKLDMNLTDIEFTSFGMKIIFHYKSPGRVDFRELLKDLTKKFRERVELHQIPMNDTAMTSGSIGPCGMELCLFIKSVMNQENGKNRACSEFNCCLEYKDPFYEDKRSRLPKLGDYITTHTGDMGRVEKLDLWKEEFVILTDKGVLKKYVSALLKEVLNKKSVQFPKNFETISNETHTVEGSEKIATERLRESELQRDEHMKNNRDFIEKNFELLFGKSTLDFSLPDIDE